MANKPSNDRNSGCASVIGFVFIILILIRFCKVAFIILVVIAAIAIVFAIISLLTGGNESTGSNKSHIDNSKPVDFQYTPSPTEIQTPSPTKRPLTEQEKEHINNLLLSLFDRIHALKPYEKIDLNPPKDTDAVIYIPIEGKFDRRFFVRMFLLREHIIEGQIISQFDMVQYQIPVKASNEELILLIYGTHLFGSVDYASLLREPLGRTMCIDTDNEIRKYCPTINTALDIQDFIDEASTNRTVFESDEHNTYLLAMKELRYWIDENFKIASRDYTKSAYNSIKWVSEYRLYQNIRIFYPDAFFQYSPDWLSGQSIDIFIPSLNIGIEYQGKQHYEPVDFFGGDEKFLDNVRRDKAKSALCEEHDVVLYYWKYDKRLWFSSIANFLNADEQLIEQQLLKCLPRAVSDLFSVETYSQHIAKDKQVTKEKHKKERMDSATVIRRYSVDGEYLDESNSIKQASEKCGIGISGIQKCLSGERKTSGGFVWSRETRQSQPLSKQEILQQITKKSDYENTGLSKPVFQVDPQTGEILTVFESISKAARSVDIHSKGIKDVINGKQKTAGGFKWSYADPERKKGGD